MRNVLLLDQFGELGGAQQCLLDLVPALEEAGWKPFAATPDGSLPAALRSLGVETVALDAGRYTAGQKSGLDVLRYAARTPPLAASIRDLCIRWRIHLLYVNGPRLLPAAALGARDVPLLFHAHSVVPAGIQRRLLAWSLRHAHAALAVSRFVALSLPPGAVVVPNGVTDLARPRPPAENLRIGVIGRIAPEKGQREFILAARRISPRRPDCRFIVCGAPVIANPSYANEVQHRAEGLPVTFLGWRESVADVLAELDIAVVPSLGDEGFGRTVIEAFSAGVPVVAFPSGGIPELVKDEITGFLVNGRTASALAARILQAIEQPEKRRSVAAHARSAWHQQFTLAHYRSRVIQQMDRAADTGTKSPPPARVRLR